LAGIESLLSAVVVDGMTGRRHKSNCELMAQGFANIGSVLFGGILVEIFNKKKYSAPEIIQSY